MSLEGMLFDRYRGKRLLLDSNLLLLYLTGSFQRVLVPAFKRTQMFSLSEFDLLVNILRQFSVLVTTPHILTEVNSLANQLPSNLKGGWLDFFASEIARFEEIRTPAEHLFKDHFFNPFGLADAALHNASRDTLVMSNDFRLTGLLRSRAVAAINIRAIYLSIGDHVQ